MLIVFLIFNILFTIYFYYTGVWFLGVLPLLFVIFILMSGMDIHSSGGKMFDKEKLFDTLLANAYYLAWCLVLFGMWGILYRFNLFGTDKTYIALYMIIFNLILWFLSYILRYRDGIKTFTFGYIFTILLFVISLLWKFSFSWVINTALVFLVFSFGIYSFVYFVMGNFFELFSDKIKYIVFLLFNVTLITFLYTFLSESVYVAILCMQIYLGGLFMLIYQSGKLENYFEEEEESIRPTLQEILQRKKIKTKEIKQTRQLKTIFEELTMFFSFMPESIKAMLGTSNLVLVFIYIILFLVNITHEFSIFYQVIYWIGIGVFFGNFLLVKLINFHYYIQRIFAFFIINFAIYLSILNIFGGNIPFIVIVGIIWNILNNLFIFSTQSLKDNKVLFKEDYYLWIFSNFLAMMVNIYFVLRLPLDMYLRLSIVLLYLGVQLFLMFYNFKFIEKD